MRFLTRLHVLFLMAIVFILYFNWVQPSLHIQARIQKAWKGSSHRIVVFGDDWSDTGVYRVSPPTNAALRDRDPDRGEVWTEALCRELICDQIDNFARSVQASGDKSSIGSLLSSDIHGNTTVGIVGAVTPLFDFYTQVQQFINFEKQKWLAPGVLTSEDRWTVFTVYFGVWDLLEYTALEEKEATHAVQRTIKELFRVLDILAESFMQPLYVVIPKAVDVTFLPRFQMRRNDSASAFAQEQHQSVYLWRYWNQALSQAAADWDHGDIFMLDTNSIVMNQVRAQQLYSKHINDASGYGKQKPLFEEVERPCLSTNTDSRRLQAAEVEKCIDPARYLFWDEIQLNGPLHQLIGREAGRLLRGNDTVNIVARERRQQEKATSKIETSNSGAGFDLKMPPGY
ncbi:hypothetical protein P154DRAFT_357683 [Amniculicola lignicola CBS 123094]|uniref:Carbohydrate esterase family 16 protein n=1 Tax=Amniculicola lignicola CBS 123094 TaxID=1392246 RepID=A0A6A5X2E1_9PLEO|nr:hypothetical protein P154DRAFT_357683 [Amniculicola lignicola CBS 123094]